MKEAERSYTTPWKLFPARGEGQQANGLPHACAGVMHPRPGAQGCGRLGLLPG